MATASMLMGVVVVLSTATSAQAAGSPAQFGGVDQAAYVPGSSWTYDQNFNYNGNGASVTVNEVVTYTVAGQAAYNGYDTRQINISGHVTGGGGQVSGYSFDVHGGSVSGVEYLRRSDLAMVYQEEEHDVTGCVHVSIACVSAAAQAQYRLTPSPPWRKEAFRLHVGDAWNLATTVNVAGFLHYQSQGPSGGSNFNSNFAFDANVGVLSAPTISVPAGAIPTYYVDAQATNSSAVDKRWWAPSVDNVASEHLVIPLNGGATGTIDRYLVSSHLASPSTPITESLSPDLSCAGGNVVVSGSVGSGGAGVTATLDQSSLGAGTTTTRTTTTNVQGGYSVSFPAPAQADGLQKSGVIGSWGIVVDAAGSSAVATLEVVPGSCATLAYTGPKGAAEGQSVTLSATVTDPSNGAPVSGAPVDFVLGSQDASATTDAQGVATTTLAPAESPGNYTLDLRFPGVGPYAAAEVSVPFQVGQLADLVYTGPVAGAQGHAVTLSSVLTDGTTGVPIQGATVGFTLGSQSVQAITNSSGTADAGLVLNQPLGLATLAVAFSGNATYAPAGLNVEFRIGKLATIAYTGPPGAAHGQAVTLSATLADGTTGVPIQGATVSFTLGPQSVQAITDAQGVATAPLTVAASKGYYTLDASFAGNDTYAPVTAAVPFEVGSLATISYTGPVSGRWGTPVALSATLTDAITGGPIANEPLVFTVDGDTIGAITDAQGVAGATWSPAGVPGTYPLTVSFAGADGYVPASTSASFHVGWQYTFTDLLARGTVYLNPGNDLFEVAPLGGTSSGVVSDPSMTVVALPTGNHVVDVTYTSPAIILQGDFVEETGQFSAVVDTVSNVSVLERP